MNNVIVVTNKLLNRLNEGDYTLIKSEEVTKELRSYAPKATKEGFPEYLQGLEQYYKPVENHFELIEGLEERPEYSTEVTYVEYTIALTPEGASKIERSREKNKEFAKLFTLITEEQEA